MKQALIATLLLIAPPLGDEHGPWSNAQDPLFDGQFYSDGDLDGNRLYGDESADPDTYLQRSGADEWTLTCGGVDPWVCDASDCTWGVDHDLNGHTISDSVGFVFIDDVLSVGSLYSRIYGTYVYFFTYSTSEVYAPGRSTLRLRTENNATAYDNGGINIYSGNQTNAGDYTSGDITITSGDTTTDGLTGSITLTTGAAGAGSGDAGYFVVNTHGSNQRLAIDGAGEVTVNSVSGDGTGKAVCIKADGTLGTCSDAVGAGGTCTCG